jgi:hypothetical protein
MPFCIGKIPIIILGENPIILIFIVNSEVQSLEKIH